MGSAPTTQQVIAANQTSQGPAGLRHNAHVAFSTAYDLLGQLAGYNLRRKAFIYVSNGYDFDPFKDARFKAEQEKYDMPLRRVETGEGSAQILNPFSRQGSQFAAADLVGELFELTRAAREANVTFYTLDPRGLTAGPDITDRLSTAEWRDNIRTTTSSLEVSAPKPAASASAAPTISRRVSSASTTRRATITSSATCRRIPIRCGSGGRSKSGSPARTCARSTCPSTG